MKRRWLFLALIGFFISRIYILKFPPVSYSDVFHDYRRYVNMWHDGLTPYFKHFYEYPPATIPLLYTPFLIKQQGIGHFYQNYRAQAFILDFLIFIFILKALARLKIKPINKAFSLVFYFLASMIAKDFFYEGIDLVFIGCLSLSLISLLLFNQKQFLQRLLFWIFFWLSTSIKFLSLPLLAPFFYLRKLNLVQEIKAFALGFLIIWAPPLIIFRGALKVMLAFHYRRGIKYAAFPSFVVETINYFTQTETRFNQAPDFQLLGPVSSVAEKVVAVVFPLSILLVLAYAFWIILKPNLKKLNLTLKQLFQSSPFNLSHLDPYAFSIKITLIYFLTIFFTAKIFSQPFHIWYLPLIALFPFKSLKQQLSFMFLAVFLLIVDTTPWIRLDEQLMVLPPLPLKFFIYLFLRYLPLSALLFLSFKLPHKAHQ